MAEAIRGRSLEFPDSCNEGFSSNSTLLATYELGNALLDPLVTQPRTSIIFTQLGGILSQPPPCLEPSPDLGGLIQGWDIKAPQERVPTSILQTYKASRASISKAKTDPGGMSKLGKYRVINTYVQKSPSSPMSQASKDSEERTKVKLLSSWSPPNQKFDS